MRVTVLGAGDAFCSSGRRHSGYFVETRDVGFLLDCGATTLLALKTLNIAAERIDFIAISHLHGDHFGGLPFLFLEYTYEKPRTKPLVIIGPPDSKSECKPYIALCIVNSRSEVLCFPLQFHEVTQEKRKRLTVSLFFLFVSHIKRRTFL